MLTIAVVTSILWFGVGICIGFFRSLRAYKLEILQYGNLANWEPKRANFSALLRAFLVLYGWTVAGLLGAIIWLIMCLWLMFGGLISESTVGSSSKKRDTKKSNLVVLVAIAALLSVDESSLRADERYFDSFVIGLSVVVTGLVILAAYLLWKYY